MASPSQKKEAAEELLARIAAWPASKLRASSCHSGGLEQAGPLACATVDHKTRFFCGGTDYTKEVSDIFGLGMRGEFSSGVRIRNGAWSPDETQFRQLIEHLASVAESFPDRSCAHKCSALLNLWISAKGNYFKPETAEPVLAAAKGLGIDPAIFELNEEPFFRAACASGNRAARAVASACEKLGMRLPPDSLDAWSRSFPSIPSDDDDEICARLIKLGGSPKTGIEGGEFAQACEKLGRGPLLAMALALCDCKTLRADKKIKKTQASGSRAAL